MNPDREARKAQLAQAKERLAKRRREREQLRALREQRKQGQPTTIKRDYGQAQIAETKQLIQTWEKAPAKPAEAVGTTQFS